MKILFATRSWSHHQLQSGSKLFPVPRRFSSDLNQWPKFASMNSGNLVHFEAVTGMFGNQEYSAQQNLVHLMDSFDSISDFKRWMRRRFDAVVLSCANDLRPSVETKKLNIALDALDIPIYAFGMGLQDDIPLSSLSKSNIERLQILNEKAELFAVRGHYTEEFLHKNGMTNVKALGCPSLFVHPEGIKRINFSENKLQQGSRIITAGHFSPHYLKPNTRAHQMVQTLQALKDKFDCTINYVFQDELPKLPISQAIQYYDASSQVDHSELNKHLSNSLNLKDIPIDNYYFFKSVSAWRAFASTHDLYLGDRFHGGVAALQAAVNSYFIGTDLRLRELCEFFELPFFTPEQLIQNPAKEIAKSSKKTAANFQENYLSKYKSFMETAKERGLQVSFDYNGQLSL